MAGEPSEKRKGFRKTIESISPSRTTSIDYNWIGLWKALMKVLLLPLDDRPVTYVYPQLVAKGRRHNPIVPPRALFGNLNAAAKVEGLVQWCDAAITRERPGALLICLDTLLYGGLTIRAAAKTRSSRLQTNWPI